MVTRRAVRRDISGDTITAAITVFTAASVELGVVHDRPWQKLAWQYWAALGELYYPTTQIARLLTRIDWEVMIDGRVLTRDPDARDEVDVFLERVTDGLGRQEAIRLLALNIQVAGKCWYTHHPRYGWACLSVIEPKLREIRDDDAYTKLIVEVLDPRDQRYAISPFISLIEPAEELLTYGAQSRTQSRSRLATAGILLRPSEAVFDDADGESFGDDLELAATTAIADERSTAALMPIDVEQPAELIDKWRYLTFARPYDDKLDGRIERAISRIATGLDVPAELLLGISDQNHWNAWLIQEETYTTHAEPLAERIGEVFAVAGEQLDLGDRIIVTPVPGKLFTPRVSVADALAAARIGAVGLDFVRKTIGATKEDAPSEEDVAIILALTASGRPVPGLAPTPEVTPGPPPLPAVAASGYRELVPAVITAALVPAPEDLATALPNIDGALRAELLGAMAMAVRTARSRVGAKARSAVRRTPEHDTLRDVDNTEIAAHLGARVYQLLDVEDTVRSALSELLTWWRETLVEACTTLRDVAGVDTSDPAWDVARDRSAASLEDNLTTWIVATITRTNANMLATPADLAREVVAVAGGST